MDPDFENDIVTEDERDEYRLAYELFDSDNSGGITKEKLAAVMKRLGQTPSDQEIDDMINEVDADENGKIEFEEFVLLMARNKKSHDTEEEFQELFKIFDKNKTNRISKNDLREVLTAIGETLSENELDEIMKEADLDGKGHILYDEFVRMMGGQS